MPQVGVRELKNGLSRYLKLVQGGGEILVTERGRSVISELQTHDTNGSFQIN